MMRRVVLNITLVRVVARERSNSTPERHERANHASTSELGGTGNPFVTREYFRMVEPFFTGKSVFDFEHVEARVRNSMYHLGVGNQLTACLAGVNVALFDAIARGFGVRVCDLIGGCRTMRIPAYASTGFFSDDPERQLSHMLAEAAGHPYVGAKIKIGRGVRNDVERVREAREALGPDKLLMVDINGAYTVDVALECARAIAPFDIHWIEEPLPPGDFAGYAIHATGGRGPR